MISFRDGSKWPAVAGTAVVGVCLAALTFSIGTSLGGHSESPSVNPTSESVDASSDAQAVDPLGDSPFTVDSLKGAVEQSVSSRGGECHNGWREGANGIEYCIVESPSSMYLVFESPDYELMESFGTYTGDSQAEANGEIGTVVMWNSSAGVAVPADDSEWIEQFADACADGDQCLVMFPGDEGPSIVGLRS